MRKRLAAAKAKAKAIQKNPRARAAKLGRARSAARGSSSGS